jgi:hypothetical protein
MVTVQKLLNDWKDILCLNPDTSFLHISAVLALLFKQSAIYFCADRLTEFRWPLAGLRCLVRLTLTNFGFDWLKTANGQRSTANDHRIPFTISGKSTTFAAQLIFFKQNQGNEQL